MPVTPKAGKGTIIKMGNGDGPPETFTEVPGFQDIDGPDLGGSDEYDATHHSSSAKEYITGLKDAGEMTAPLVYDGSDTQQAAVRDLAGTDTVKNWQIALPDADTTVLQFAALVKSFKFNAPVQGVLTVNVTFRITGAIQVNPV